MEDPRCNLRNQVQHPIDEILFLSISAVVSGADTWKAIWIFGQDKLEWMQQFFPFEQGVPWPSTLSRFFAKLDSEAFGKYFIEWTSQLASLTQGEVVAFDGKTMRGSSNSTLDKDPIHIVSAFASLQGVCLGQVATDEKSNEITAIPRLLELLTLKGCTVTIDAMGCQKKIAQRIIQSEADYILQVKKNQKGLLEQIEKVFKLTEPIDIDTHRDLGHGRIERRTCEVVNNLQHLDDYKDWPGLKVLLRIQSRRENKTTGKVEQATRYYISSKMVSAKTFQSDVRRHWTIENNLHWSLDVQFNEDRSRKRIENSAANYGILTRIALNMIKQYPTHLSQSNKRMKAALNDKVREEILGL